MKRFSNLENEVSLTRVNNCVNGNPRYAVHFLHLLTKEERNSNDDINTMYIKAIHKAKAIGGRKYHTKSYGGGIVFSSYNVRDEISEILKLNGEAIECHRPPNKYELKMGYGATHYRTFLKSDIMKKDGTLKKFFKADDGLYYSTK
jgi:hypothetical protein